MNVSSQLATGQSVANTIHARRSIRKYKKMQVPTELITALLEAAFAAPFSIGSHALRIMVIRNHQVLETLSDGIKDHSTDFLKKGRVILRRRIPLLFPQGIVPFLNFRTVLGQFKAAMKMEQDIWWGSPTLILMFARKDASPTYEIDVAAAMENVTVLATAFGLGTCIVKWTELINFYSDLRSIIGIPDGWWVIVGICVGYPIEVDGPKKSPHRPIITDPDYVQWRN